jgi:hypothetical protein
MDTNKDSDNKQMSFRQMFRAEGAKNAKFFFFSLRALRLCAQMFRAKTVRAPGYFSLRAWRPRLPLQNN